MLLEFLLQPFLPEIQADQRCWEISKGLAASALSRRSTDPKFETAVGLKLETLEHKALVQWLLELLLRVLVAVVWQMRWLQLFRRERRKLAEVVS